MVTVCHFEQLHQTVRRLDEHLQARLYEGMCVAFVLNAFWETLE